MDQLKEIIMYSILEVSQKVGTVLTHIRNKIILFELQKCKR